MKKKKKTIFDGIRKPLPPPSQHQTNRKKKLDSDKVGRKDKHKGKEAE